MKNIIKIFVSIAFLLLIVLISNKVEANSINSISMDIYVDKNGDAQVTEIWDCSANKGTEVYHPYYNLGRSEITDLKVYDGDTEYITLTPWSTSGTLSKKANKCGLHQISKGVEICWGISKYGSHVYTVKYKITNFISVLQDSQMIYWTLIPHDFSNEIGKARIKIHSDSAFDNRVEVWGYGDYGGKCYVHDGYVDMQSNGSIEKEEYMTILVKFPENYFESTNTNPNNFEYYLNMAEKDSVKYSTDKITKILFKVFYLFIFIIGLSPIFLILFMPRKRFDELKNKKKINKKEFFREIPYDGDIFKAYFIAKEYNLLAKKNNIFGAIILKWIKDGVIKLEKRAKKNSSKEEVVLILDKPDLHTFTNASEASFYKYLYEASQDEILENQEFEKWCKKHYKSITGWFLVLVSRERDALVADGLIRKEETASFLGSKRKTYYATDKLNEYAQQLAGLKRYLTQYSLISDREPVEVHLFEEFLIYAQMLGIADKVANSFKNLYPDMINDSCYHSYDNIHFVYHHSYHGLSSAFALQRADNYFSSSGGGGGHSSGGGGHGSFGGGGGGGGFR